jgi:hypothetical protein
MNDTERGLYAKYRVQKIIRGKDQRGEEVENLLPVKTEYFVLKAGDPYAPIALLHYAEACEQTYPQLARELKAMAGRWQSS